MNESAAKNQLSKETSPYLLQHQHNPVDWHPWGETALKKAKDENKPILLSIGYSACHWCHVMAHESFENKDTAALMNKHFINIKVDREERPDLDKIYQMAHSLLTQRPGGWPLTVFLTADEQMPFFAGTYFPDHPHQGMPSFSEILLRIADAYKNNQESIQQQNTSILDVFNNIAQQDKSFSEAVNAMPIDSAKNQLKKNFDEKFGGFGDVPKFPHPSHLEFALKQWKHSVENQQEDFDILNTASYTLQMMAKGGIFDQLGGGFCRYSVDDQWLIPHFEKMLYDNGPLLALYSQAHTVIETPLFEDTTLRTAHWVITEMQAVNGGYYSSLDADSENTEGKFYVWTADEIKQYTPKQHHPILTDYFGLDKSAHFEDKYWILHQAITKKDLAEKYDIEIHQLSDIISQCKQLLFAARNKRIRPNTDDKILTSWNALMIRGMCIAGRTFEREEFIESAKKSLSFIKKTMWHDGQLYATHKDGKTQHNAYLDDYAYLLDACLELLQAEWCNEYLNFAIELANGLLSNFEHKDIGGFYFTSHNHEQLILRQKNFADDATPSGNGVAAIALYKLGYLLAEPKYLMAAERTIKAGFEQISQSPLAHTSLLQALDVHLNEGITSLIIRGDKSQARHWQKLLNSRYLPQLQHFYLPDNIALHPALVSKSITGEICAYLCKGTSCSVPITSNEDLLKLI